MFVKVPFLVLVILVYPLLVKKLLLTAGDKLDAVRIPSAERGVDCRMLSVVIIF